jgi:hypothetical protein
MLNSWGCAMLRKYVNKFRCQMLSTFRNETSILPPGFDLHPQAACAL